MSKSKAKAKSTPKTTTRSRAKNTSKTTAKSKEQKQTKAKSAPKFTGLFLWSKIPQLESLENDCQQDSGQKEATEATEATERAIKLDAANAVKRVAEFDLVEVGANSLTLILNLTNMRVTNFAFEKKEEQEYLHLFCEYEYKIAICPCCGEASVSSHEGKKRSVRHLDIWGKTTIIHFTRRRFECQKCLKPFTERLDWIDLKRRQTLAFEEMIYECLTVQKMSRRATALALGLHEQTVLRIFKKKAKETLRKPVRKLVRVLGVDEIYLGRKNYVLILSDIEKRRIVAILPDRQKETLVKYFEGLSQEQRKAIKVVSIDMWKAYRSAAREKLPHARIVADRFHVMKQLNHQLDLLRRKLRRDSKKGSELSELLKNSRWILLKNGDDLNEHEKSKLQLILAASTEISRMYLMKEEFRLICNKIKNKKQASHFIRYWLFRAEYSGCRYLKKFAKTLRNWRREFLNYFIEGITQGVVEGLNRAIRGIINRSFGFRKFEHFRLQVLAEYSLDT